MPTVFSYVSVDGFPDNAPKTLSTNLKTLVTRLNAVKPGETYETFGSSKQTDALTVFVLHRCYPASVRSDYRHKFRFQHDFGTLAFAVDTSSSSLLIKIANRALAREVHSWAASTLDVTLRDPGSSLFSDYLPDSVERAFLGGYDESHGVDLLQLAFRQSFGPNHSPLTVTAAPLSRSIREDLRWLKEAKIIRIRSLAEISSLTARFESAEMQIKTHIDDGGAIRFKLDDAGLGDGVPDRFRAAFKQAFLVPIDQGIDPTLLAMGPSEIYQFLLSDVSDDEVMPYQRESLAKLIEWKLLNAVTRKTGKCTDLHCSSFSQVVVDETLKQCPTCENDLAWKSIQRYEHDPKAVYTVARLLLQKATAWKLATTPQKFESHAFRRLSSKTDLARTVCVFFNNRLRSGKIETFQRAMFPIVVVHTQGDHRLPVIDSSGIAHIGLPYAIAAFEDKADWRDFKHSCRNVIGRLLQMEQERVLSTSRYSYDHIRAKPVGYNDRNFEADIFNLLRSVFPYTVKWGGGNRPDGFCRLIYFEGSNLSNPTKFNWSYDAKFSESTYPFEIGEFRQMYDYITSLHRPKRLKSEGNRYDAHFIITNEMNRSAMHNAANYLRTGHRLAKDYPDFMLVFMRQGFLTRLWEKVRESELEILKRRTYLPEYFVSEIRARTENGFAELDESAADQIVADVLRQTPTENPIDADELKRDLKQVTSRKGKRPSAATGAG
jgi:hypothetical protein